MSITLGTSARNASCSAVTALANGGKLKLKSAGGTVLATFSPLNNPAFAAASGGSQNANGLPLSTSGLAAAGSGTNATQYDVTDSSDAVLWSGTCTITGGGGDLTVDNPNIAQNQAVSVTSWAHSQPAS